MDGHKEDNTGPGSPASCMVRPMSSKENESSSTYDVRVLGCKVNAYEAQQIRHGLELSGLRPADEGESADIVVVHTCAVTSTAVKKSRQTVRRAQKANPGARVIVTGCAASENILASLQGVHARIGPREGWLTAFRDEVGDLAGEVQWDAENLAIDTFHAHSRAFLKVQDGCDIGCTFCIVPKLRRAPRDKPLPQIAEEAKRLANSGHKEIVICGVSVGLYGKDSGGPNLAQVLQRVSAIPGVERIRLSSLHPGELTDELLDVWAASPKVLPHLHLPLQSGSDRILAAMRRNYTASEFLAAVARARKVLDNPAFNTDVITGFPGESEEDFQASVALSKEVGFSRMHVFPYSPRPHTRAVRLEGRLDPAIARERTRRLGVVGSELRLQFYDRFRGSRARVLVEDWNPESSAYRGYTERYIPVEFQGAAGLRGEIVEIRLENCRTDPVSARLQISASHELGNK